MAGTYPDVVGKRMAYDRDGSIAYSHDSSDVIAEFDQANFEDLNSESTNSAFSFGGGAPTVGYRIGIIFPELRDIAGYFLAGAVDDPGSNEWLNIETSPDTTIGLDGTWTLQDANVHRSSTVAPAYRSSIQTMTVSGIKGVRFRMQNTGSGESSNLMVWHLYGDIASGQSPNRLRLWHPTLNQEVTPAYFDWGDVARNSTGTIDFRVKNNSATQTAGTITVLGEALTDTVPTVDSQHLFSISGGAYASSIAVPDLAAGAISSVITMRRIVTFNATLSVWAMRIVAAAVTWV